jgi:hypothetical protein
MKIIFQWLARMNKLLLPKYYRKDLRKLNAFDKIVIAWKVWVVKKILP